MNNLKKKYDTEITKTLSKEYAVYNLLALPHLEKVVVNMGIGQAIKNKELLKSAATDLAAITGQRPSVRQAKLSVASFSLRKGMKIGLTSTLRGDRMYDFLERLFSIVLPRLRDFRGLKVTSFDGQGNYTLGITDHTVFPEIDLAKVSTPLGMEVTIVTSTKNKEQAKRLLELLGMPFEKEENG
jgi:large subunit ribosomal protein L5